MIAFIGIGGILGTLSRFYLGKWIFMKTGGKLPWGTFIINLSGSFILGLLFGLFEQHALPLWFYNMFGIGYCGAYTTFSTFGYETNQLFEQKLYTQASLYILGSVLLGLLFAFMGLTLARL
ncbi:MAG: chromosome condensation protein CrcB [Paenibacillus sp. RIFOXYA1_FULL_44_5]|nr:MAG: chromosome condensation protein CrcB [Paenibacillus sp. RIFOXYA1_FULL_44_5]